MEKNKMENDKVLDAFNQASQNYDNYRKNAIPYMDIFYNTAAELTTNYQNPEVLDLGAGTGILTEKIYQKHPNSNITLIDISKQMLDKAQKKFTQNNFQFIEADYINYNYTQKYDVIVSSLSIHHLTDDEKKKLYKKVYDILEEDGIFINADQVQGSTPQTEQKFKDKDKTHLEKQDIPLEEKKTLQERRKLDQPATLDDTIKWYKEIGYKNVDVYYKYYRYYVIAGEK